MSITTYDGPGRARKQCPNGHYVHARSAMCACGHKFRETVEETKSIATFDSPGRGKRQCPECKIYVGVRTPVCICGFAFDGYKSDKPTVYNVTYDEGGRGKKQCPDCNAFVGARTAMCVCGHDFNPQLTVESSVSYDIETEDEPDYIPLTLKERLGYPNHKCTLIPSGECPFKLTSSDDGAVIEWIDRVQKVYLAKNEILAPSGFTYYAAHYFAHFTPEHNKIKRVINEHFAKLLA